MEPQPITPQRVFEILRKYDDQVTLKQASDVLDFLTRLADLAFEQYLDDYYRTPNLIKQ